MDATDMKDKYRELIEGPLRAVLPAQFKLISKMQRALDEAIVYFKNRKKITKFDEISKSVEGVTGRKFGTKEFAVILGVDRDLYEHEWK